MSSLHIITNNFVAVLIKSIIFSIDFVPEHLEIFSIDFVPKHLTFKISNAKFPAMLPMDEYFAHNDE